MACAIDEFLKVEFLCDPDCLERAACSSNSDDREEFLFAEDHEKRTLVEEITDVVVLDSLLGVLWIGYEGGVCG